MRILNKSIQTAKSTSINHNHFWLNSIFVSIKCSLLIILVIYICYTLIISLLPKIFSIFSADSTTNISPYLNNYQYNLQFYSDLAEKNAVILKAKGYDLSLLAQENSLDLAARIDNNNNNNKIKVGIDFTFSNTLTQEIQTIIKENIQSATQLSSRLSLLPKDSPLFYLRRDSFQQNACQGVDLPGNMFKSAIQHHLIVFVLIDDNDDGTINKDHNKSNIEPSDKRSQASYLYITSSICQMWQEAYSTSIPQAILLRIKAQQILNDFPFTWRTLIKRIIQQDIVRLLDTKNEQGEHIIQENLSISQSIEEIYDKEQQQFPAEKGQISKLRVLSCGQDQKSLVLDGNVLADCESLLSDSKCFYLTQTAGEHANLQIQSKNIQLEGQCFRFSCKKNEISKKSEINVQLGKTTMQSCSSHPKIHRFKKSSQVYSVMCPKDAGIICEGD